MVFRHHLYQSLPLFAKENEVLGNIEQPFLCRVTTENGLQAYDRMFFFVVDLFPFRKMFVQGSDGSEFALEAAGKDDERIVPEEMRYCILVITQIIVGTRSRDSCGWISVR